MTETINLSLALNVLFILYFILSRVRPHLLVQEFIKRFKKYWAKISGKVFKSPGRPPVSEETKSIIKRMLRENTNIGGLRIYMNLFQLGINDASLSSVYRIIREFKKDLEFARLVKSQKWRTFLYNSRVVAMDFLTVSIEVSKDVFQLLYVFIIIDHERRRVVHYNCTSEPTQEWVIQQFKNCFGCATEIVDGENHNYKYMIHDRDATFMYRVRDTLPKYFGIQSKPTAPHSPWQNPFVESFNGTLRRELLKHVVVKDEFRLRERLNEYVDFYNNHRMHSGLMDSPFGGTIQKRPPGAKLKSRPVLNGLHHIYYWSGNEPGQADLKNAA